MNKQQRTTVYVLITTAIGLSIFLGGCNGNGIDPSLSKFADGLSVTSDRFERTFAAYEEEEFRSIQGTTTQRYGTTWAFEFVDDARRFVHIHPTTEEWQSHIEDYSGGQKMEELFLSFQGSHLNLFNEKYSANLTGAPRRVVAVHEEKLYRALSEFNMEALFTVYPFFWSLEKFARSDGTGAVNVSESKGSPSMSVLQCSVELADIDTPFDGAVKGEWQGNYDSVNNCFVSQQLKTDSYVLEVKYELSESDSSPKVVETTYRELESDIELKKSKEFKVVETGHRLADTASSLSFYGLPEPPSSKVSNSSGGWIWLAVATCLIVLLICQKRLQTLRN